MANQPPPRPNGGNGEGVSARVAGQNIAVRSTYPIVFALLVVASVGLVWIVLDKVQGERKDMLTQMLGTLDSLTTQHNATVTAMTVQQREDNREIRLLIDTKDKETRQRYVYGLEVVLRNFLNLRHSLEHPASEHLPVGVLPPGMEEALKRQVPER